MSMECLLSDIRRQPESLLRVVDHHYGPGRSDLEITAELLRQAPAIILTGMGASLFACTPLQYYLASKGYRVMMAETAELLHYQLELCRGSIIVVVSRSGDTVEVRKLLNALPDCSRVIGVTNEAGSCLANRARAVLVVTNHADNLVAVQSYTGQLATLMTLGISVAGESEAAWRTLIDGAVAEMPQVIDDSLDSMVEARPFLDSARVVHLLGRGLSCASCAEGALLFNEVAKLPAIPLPAGLFRHGPVEVVDREFRGVVFAPEGKTRHLNLELAQNVTSFGGQVYVVGSGPAALNGLKFWKIPATNESLVPLFEVIAVQVAAWQVAQWRGVGLDGFRYVSRVTLDETTLGAIQPSRRRLAE